MKVDVANQEVIVCLLLIQMIVVLNLKKNLNNHRNQNNWRKTMKFEQNDEILKFKNDFKNILCKFDYLFIIHTNAEETFWQQYGKIFNKVNRSNDSEHKLFQIKKEKHGIINLLPIT